MGADETKGGHPFAARRLGHVVETANRVDVFPCPQIRVHLQGLSLTVSVCTQLGRAVAAMVADISVQERRRVGERISQHRVGLTKHRPPLAVYQVGTARQSDCDRTNGREVTRYGPSPPPSPLQLTTANDRLQDEED